MKAVIYTEYGGPQVLRLSEVEKPVPGEEEVLVKVYASSVTAGVQWIRRGEYPGSKIFSFLIRLMYGLKRPKNPVLGFEYSGVVESVGSGVKGYQPGDQVFGTTTGLRQGAYAEYVVVPQAGKECVLAKMPSVLSFEESAVLPIGGMTALFFLRKAGVRAGERVLVYGASGSVGTYAVQIAKAMGAQVTGFTSAGNFELVRSIGADEVMDYSRTDLAKSGLKFDVIFDAVGKIPSGAVKKCLAPKGVYVTVKSMTNEKNEYLKILSELVTASRLKPVIDRVYPLSETAEAHRYAGTGHKKGNVVIRVE